VRAHKSAVGVDVFEERNQRGGNRYELLRTNIDVIDFVPRNQDEVAGLTGIDEIVYQAALVIEFDVRLRDDVAVFLPRREIERKGLIIRRFLALTLEFFVDTLDLVQFNVITNTVFAVTAVDDLDQVLHTRALHATVRRFDEVVVVDARRARP